MTGHNTIKEMNYESRTLREYIYQINIERYGDPLGPTFDFLFRKYDGDYNKVIQAASKYNSDIDKLLGGFGEWLIGKLS